jgi:hypothetical protein
MPVSHTITDLRPLLVVYRLKKIGSDQRQLYKKLWNWMICAPKRITRWLGFSFITVVTGVS